MPVEFSGDVDVVHEALDVEWQVGAVGAHQLLELLGLLGQAHTGARVGRHVQLVLLAELFGEVLHQDVVKVFAAQAIVKCGGQNLALGERRRDASTACY